MVNRFTIYWICALGALCSPVLSHAEDFHGYPCTEGCSGHEAGYKWAEENDITDPDDCKGDSKSFIEGCQAWAEENGDDEGDEDDDEE